MRQLRILAILLISAGGCASVSCNMIAAELGRQTRISMTDVHPPEVDEWTDPKELVMRVNLSSADALQTAEDSLVASGFEIESKDEAGGVVRTKATKIGVPDECDCGRFGTQRIKGSGQAIVVVSVREHSKTDSIVTVENGCSTTLIEKKQAVRCVSTGDIERRFWKPFLPLVKGAQIEDSAQGAKP